MGTSFGQDYISLRPGASITLHLESSDPSVIAIDNPDVTIQTGTINPAFKVRPLQNGKATIKVVPPDGYGTFPAASYGAQSQVTVTVDPVRITTYGVSGRLGKDQQVSVSWDTELTGQLPALPYTITSSDPSLLLISASQTELGGAQATITAQPHNAYLQALANSGTVTVTISSPGAQSASFTVQLAPSAIVFGTFSNTLSLSVNGFSQQFGVQFSPLDPTSLQPSCCGVPRPGWTSSVTVTSSDPKVVSVTPAAVQFPASTTPQVTLKPLAAGTAIVSLSLAPGTDTPSSGRQIVVNVR
jgi:hypothetical protein